MGKGWTKARVWLPVAFQDGHMQAVLKYLDRGRQALSRADWLWALDGFDLLHEALADTPEGFRHFASLYETQIEAAFADRYIADLLALEDVSAQAAALWARYARAITALWREAGWQRRLGSEARLLLAYWLFWWEAFATGYAFEVEIFRDLKASNITFIAHDIRSREGRRSLYDLEVLGLRGDIKTSLYFLHAGRSPGVRHDFYISRFRYRGRQRVIVVLMQPAAWKRIDGEPEHTTWAAIKAALPAVASVRHEGREVILVEYEAWKVRVLHRQQKQER